MCVNTHCFYRRLRAALSAQKHAGTTTIPGTMTTTSDDNRGVGAGVGRGRGGGAPWTLSLSKVLFSTCFVDCGGMHDNEDYVDNYGYDPLLLIYLSIQNPLTYPLLVHQ